MPKTVAEAMTPKPVVVKPQTPLNFPINSLQKNADRYSRASLPMVKINSSTFLSKQSAKTSTAVVRPITTP